MSEAIAAVIAEYMSVRVEHTTRAANVDALKPCSACRIRQSSRISASSVVGRLPLSMKKQVAGEPELWVGLDSGLTDTRAPIVGEK